MADDADLAPLADALRRVLGGDRDPELAERVDDPVQRAVVVTVLGHIGAGRRSTVTGAGNAVRSG
jgi:hypothetical protein